MMVEHPIQRVISDIANTLVTIDSSKVPFQTRSRSYSPGVGPYGEPQLLKKISSILNKNDAYHRKIVTRRTPDLLIHGSWALEFKIIRPFGDNGKEAENWSVNLLHPYEGNQSSLGDCLKLCNLHIPERKAVVVIGFEHNPPVIPLEPLIESFELLAQEILSIQLGPRIVERRENLIHPIHQQLSVIAWEVLGKGESSEHLPEKKANGTPDWKNFILQI